MTAEPGRLLNMGRHSARSLQAVSPYDQGQIEQYYCSMKNIIMLDNYYSPAELADQIRIFIVYYNNYRYYESLNNVTPADEFYGRQNAILKYCESGRNETYKRRRELFEK